MIWHDKEFNKPKHWQDVFIKYRGQLIKCKYDKSQDVFLEKGSMHIKHKSDKWSKVNDISQKRSQNEFPEARGY